MNRGDAWGYVIAALFVAVFLVAAYYGATRPNRTNFGFDDRWDCLPLANADPICVKRR